jgi:ubiquinone/menaquinone biosynthesis C-methylase UbiE
MQPDSALLDSSVRSISRFMIGNDFWAKYFRIYDNLNFFPSYVELLTSICEELRPEPGSLVLDIGSGTGNLAVKLKDMGCQVVALDFCRDALVRHREKHDDSHLVLADLRHGLPFKDNSFAAIVSNNVLYTLSAEDQVRVTKGLYRILKPGGRIVIANPRAGWKPLAVYRRGVFLSIQAEGRLKTAVKAATGIAPTVRLLYYNRMLARATHYHYFEPDEQRRLLEQSGFRPASETKWVYGGQAMLDCGAK